MRLQPRLSAVWTVKRLCQTVCLAHGLRTTHLSPRVTPQYPPSVVLMRPWPVACSFHKQLDVRAVVPLTVDGDDSVKEDLIEWWWRCKGNLSFLLCWHISFNGCHGNASFFLCGRSWYHKCKAWHRIRWTLHNVWQSTFSLTRYNLNTCPASLGKHTHLRIKVSILFCKFTVFFLDITKIFFKASAVVKSPNGYANT